MLIKLKERQHCLQEDGSLGKSVVASELWEHKLSSLFFFVDCSGARAGRIRTGEERELSTDFCGI